MAAVVDVFVILVLVAVGGVLALSEIAVVSARKTRLAQLAEGGNRRARAALRLAGDPGRFLSTVQVGISLIAVGAGAFGGTTLARRLAGSLAEVPALAPHAAWVAEAVVVAGVTYLSVVLGELLPKQIALRHPEKIAMVVARPMTLLAKVTHPVVQLLSYSAAALARLVPKDPSREPGITEDEVKLIIRQATEAGVVKRAEQEMIYGVLRLGDLQAVDLMTPRHEMVTLDVADPLARTWEKIVESGHTVFPVYKDDPANIVGFVSLKDLSQDVFGNRTPDLTKHLEPPLFVPETAPALKILEKFKQTRTQIALVLDEHGAIEGLVSIHDVMEGIVGDLPSPSEEGEDPDVVKREDGSFLIDGGTSADHLKELLKLKKLPRDDGSYTTVGGLVMTKLGRIPRTGDHFRYRGWRFEVVDMDRHRVDKVMVQRLPKTKAVTTPGPAAKPDKG